MISSSEPISVHNTQRKDFPDEYSHSKDTKSTKGANEKAKANAATAIGELIEIATCKTEAPDYGGKHGNKA